MTLCVTWRDNNGDWHFVSDSRITLDSEHSDYGIKIIPFPLKIYGPQYSQTGKIPKLFDKTYGFCFSGAFLGAQTIREFLFIILQQLQATPYTDKSFENICNLVFKFYQHIIGQISNELKKDVDIDFYFTGFCPKDEVVKVAKFFSTRSHGKFNTFKTVLNHSHPNPNAIGSGKGDFYTLLKGKINKNHWKEIISVIKELIDNSGITEVGGNIQYANFDNKGNFKTAGMIMYAKNQQHWDVKYCIAGIDMNGDEFTQKAPQEFTIMGSYIDPFR